MQPNASVLNGISIILVALTVLFNTMGDRKDRKDAAKVELQNAYAQEKTDKAITALQAEIICLKQKALEAEKASK